jgi:hypothetical protein
MYSVLGSIALLFVRASLLFAIIAAARWLIRQQAARTH